MAAGFEYFSSADAGAPVLTGAAGKLAAVLDWALVGKGGWDLAFTGTNVRVYRAQTGNRFYLRLDDTPSLYSRLRAYRAMTAVSTGTNQFPNNTQAANINTWGVRKAYTTSASVPQRYWGVRTNKGIHLFIESSNISDAGIAYRSFFSFGDFPSLCEADSHNTAIICSPGVDSIYYYTLYEMTYDNVRPSINYTGAPVWAAMSGTPNGAVVSPLCGLHAPFRGSSAAHKPALVLSDRLSIGPLTLGCTNATAANNGTFPRGRFPNVSMLYGPARNVADSQLPAQDLVPFSIGSRDFLPLTIYNDGGAGGYTVDAFLLETTDTDGML